MTLLFVLAIRELGSSLFLYTSNTMVMSVLLLDYYEGGNLGKTAAFSLVQTVLLGVLIGGANWLSRGAAQGSVGAPDKIEQGRIGHDRQTDRCQIGAIAGVAGLGAGARTRVPAQAEQEFGSPELIAAAKAEGKLVYYTANFAEVEQQVIKAFNKRFPGDQGRDGARARRPAHHPRQDRGRRRQADRRRGRPFRPRADAAARRPVPGLRAAERRRLQSGCADFAANSGRAPRWSGRSPTIPNW